MDTIKVEEKGRTRFIAHRGLSGIETENTLAGLRRRGHRDYYGIETDVHVTSRRAVRCFPRQRDGPDLRPRHPAGRLGV